MFTANPAVTDSSPLCHAIMGHAWIVDEWAIPRIAPAPAGVPSSSESSVFSVDRLGVTFEYVYIKMFDWVWYNPYDASSG